MGNYALAAWLFNPNKLCDPFLFAFIFEQAPVLASHHGNIARQTVQKGL